MHMGNRPEASRDAGRYYALSIFTLLVGVIGIVALLRAPYTGFRFAQKDNAWILAGVTPGSPSETAREMVGKRVAFIGERQPDAFDLVEDFDYIPDRVSLSHFWAAQEYFSERVIPGAAVVFRFGEGSGERAFTVTPVRFPPMRVFERAGMMFFLGLLSLLIGLVVVVRRPGDVRARLFFFMVFTVGLIFLTFGSYTSRDIALNIHVFTALRIINAFAFAFFPVVFLHFCLVFPRRKRIADSRFFLAALYMTPVAVSLLFQPRVSFSSLQLLFLFGLVAGVVSIVYSYFRAETVHERYQIRWVLLGVGIFVAVFCITALIPNLLVGHRLCSDRVPSFFFILTPISMAFAITRYHLMDIDTIFDATLIYSLTFGLLAILDLAVIGLMSGIRELAMNAGDPLTSIIAMWFAIFAYIPIRNVMSSGVRKVLRRETHDPHEVSMNLNARLLHADDPRSVLNAMIHIAGDVFAPRAFAAYLFRPRPAGTVVIPLGEQDITTPFLDIVERSRALGGPLPLFEAFDGQRMDAFPDGYSGGVLVPLSVSTGPVGCIIFGNRQSERLYTSRDLKLLRTLASQTAMALEILFRREEAERREQETRRERERISREIHDGIGSSFSNAIMTLDLLRTEVNASRGDRERLLNLKQLLVDGLSGLRDLIWTIEENEYTLGDMVPHLREKVVRPLEQERIVMSFDVDVEDEQRPLSAMVRLDIIRIVQEAVANVIKHAVATSVRISISDRDNCLTVRIADNGKGFDLSGQSAGYGLRNMRRRCEEMNGEFTVRTEPGKGTEIQVRIPLAEDGKTRE